MEWQSQLFDPGTSSPKALLLIPALSSLVNYDPPRPYQHLTRAAAEASPFCTQDEGSFSNAVDTLLRHPLPGEALLSCSAWISCGATIPVPPG